MNFKNSGFVQKLKIKSATALGRTKNIFGEMKRIKVPVNA
jgi:hypothetical protein